MNKNCSARPPLDTNNEKLLYGASGTQLKKTCPTRPPMKPNGKLLLTPTRKVKTFKQTKKMTIYLGVGCIVFYIVFNFVRAFYRPQNRVFIIKYMNRSKKYSLEMMVTV